MNFSQRLCSFMANKNISAYKMSKDTGISDRLIGYWRKGEKLPNAENLIIIANYFNTSIDYLLCRTDKPNTENLSNSAIGAIGNKSTGTVTINNNTKSKEEDKPHFDETTIQLLETFQSLNFMDKAKVISLVAELSQNK